MNTITSGHATGATGSVYENADRSKLVVVHKKSVSESLLSPLSPAVENTNSGMTGSVSVFQILSMHWIYILLGTYLRHRQTDVARHVQTVVDNIPAHPTLFTRTRSIPRWGTRLTLLSQALGLSGSVDSVRSMVTSVPLNRRGRHSLCTFGLPYFYQRS